MVLVRLMSRLSRDVAPDFKATVTIRYMILAKITSPEKISLYLMCLADL